MGRIGQSASGTSPLAAFKTGLEPLDSSGFRQAYLSLKPDRQCANNVGCFSNIPERKIPALAFLPLLKFPGLHHQMFGNMNGFVLFKISSSFELNLRHQRPNAATPSLHNHYSASSLLQVAPPQFLASVLSSLWI